MHKKYQSTNLLQWTDCNDAYEMFYETAREVAEAIQSTMLIWGGMGTEFFSRVQEYSSSNAMTVANWHIGSTAPAARYYQQTMTQVQPPSPKSIDTFSNLHLHDM